MNKSTANKLFFSSLYSNLSDASNNEHDDHTNNQSKEKDVCLITNEIIEKSDRPVKLLCGHKFKYDAIYNAVKYAKYITMKNKVKLKKNELQCPYCRNIQTGLLPYYASYEKKMYVNFPEKYVMKHNKCCRVIKSGKRKGESCSKACYFKYCGVCFKKKSLSGTSSNKKVVYKPVNTNTMKCNSVLKTGKNKGNICGKSCKDGKNKCGIHNKKVSL